jgi:hypothetical protein
VYQSPKWNGISMSHICTEVVRSHVTTSVNWNNGAFWDMKTRDRPCRNYHMFRRNLLHLLQVVTCTMKLQSRFLRDSCKFRQNTGVTAPWQKFLDTHFITQNTFPAFAFSSVITPNLIEELKSLLPKLIVCSKNVPLLLYGTICIAHIFVLWNVKLIIWRFLIG